MSILSTNRLSAAVALLVAFLSAGELQAQSVAVTGDSDPLFSGSVSRWDAGNDSDSDGFGDSDLIIGDTGVGNMSVVDAIVTSSRGYIGNNTGSEGTATVSGMSAKWDTEFFLDIGRNGKGTLNVLNGASVSSPSGTGIGRWTAGTGDGSLLVEGTGSKLTSGNGLEVGSRGGTGLVEIKAGGVVASESFSKIGSLTGSKGTVSVDGVGSRWTNSGTVNIGDGGTGELSVTNGGLADLLVVRAGIASGPATLVVAGADATLSSFATEVGTSGNAQLDIESGGLVETTSSFTVGRSSGSDGTVNADGFDTKLTAGSSLLVGLEGGSVGALSLANGAHATSSSDTSVGIRADATGTIQVGGAGTQLVVGRNLHVGSQGEGSVLLLAGASIEAAGEAAIALAGGSSGQVNITGNGTSWTSANLYIGGGRSSAGGTGSIEVSDQAQVSVAGTVRVWGDGSLSLDGGTLDAGTINLEAGSTFNVTDGILVVDNFTGNLTQDGGVLSPGDSPGLTTITGDYSLNAGSVLFELDGLVRGTGYDALDISGEAFLNGTLDIDLDPAFAPSLGDSFHLFSMTGNGSITGSPTFDFADATLNSGLAWNTSSFFSTGSISVSAVPEPSSLGIVAIGLGVAFFRRRRS